MARIWEVTAMAFALQLSIAANCGDWQTAIADGFKQAPPKRMAGAPLAGTETEAGGRVWRSIGNNASFVISNPDCVVSGATDGGKTAALIDCVPEGSYQLKLEADLQPGSSQWLALGLASGDDLFWSQKGQLWLTVRGSRDASLEGQATLYAKGTSITLKSAKGADYGFNPEKASHVEIVYDQPANALTVSVNGKTLVEALPLNFKPEIKAAGIMMNFPKANDPLLHVGNFKISLKDGALQAPAAKAISGKPLFLIDSTAVKSTNLSWGLPSDKGGGISIDLQVEDSNEPTAPYFAEFEFGVKPQDAGDYNCWALVLACHEKWMSEWSWRLDARPEQPGRALEGSLSGMPRWIKFGAASLAEGQHKLRFTVDGRRSFPDDAYLFHLWKIILSPAEVEFQPAQACIELGYNPQGNMQGNATSKQNGPAIQSQEPSNISLHRGEIADPIFFNVDFKSVLPRVNPVWRDYADSGNVTGEDYYIPYLVKPLRPRFIRTQHQLSGAVKKRGDDGKLEYDFSAAIATVKAIRAVGAEPVIGLDNPPGKILPKAPVKDWVKDEGFQREWHETVASFLKASKDAQLSVKYFQCFNEPEFSYKDIPASIMIHSVAAQAVKDFDKNLQMAGIGCGNAKSAVYFEFLNYLKDHPENIDIVDYHQYQTSPAMHAKLLKELREELDRRELKRVKIAITEWGIASSGRDAHRSGVRAATYNASCLKAMSETGLLEIGGLYTIRDYESENLKFGMITRDGFLKPEYWGQWMWSQLPDENERLEVKGGDERLQAFAFRDGEGLAMLAWYDAPENFPKRDVAVSLPSEKWNGFVSSQWILDSTRHIGYLPEGAAVELPNAVRSERFKAPASPCLSFKMPPASMRLIKLRPLRLEEEAPEPRRNLLDCPDAYSTIKI